MSAPLERGEPVENGQLLGSIYKNGYHSGLVVDLLENIIELSYSSLKIETGMAKVVVLSRNLIEKVKLRRRDTRHSYNGAGRVHIHRQITFASYQHVDDSAESLSSDWFASTPDVFVGLLLDHPRLLPCHLVLDSCSCLYGTRTFLVDRCPLEWRLAAAFRKTHDGGRPRSRRVGIDTHP